MRTIVVAVALVLVLMLAYQMLSRSPELGLLWFGARADAIVDALGFVQFAAASALLIALAIRSLVAVRALRQSRLQNARIEESINALNVGVALWDAEDRLISYNDAFVRLYPEVSPLIVQGARYIDLLRSYFPLAPDSITDGRTLDRFIGETMRRRQQLPVSEMVRHHQGHWLLMTDCRTATGGIVSFRMHVTDHRLLNMELRQRRRVIDDLADLTADWYWHTDADGKFVEFSQAIETVMKYQPEQLLGRRQRDIPGFSADAKELDAHEALIAARAAFPWFRFRAVRGDGERVSVAVTGKPIVEEQGGFRGYYGAGRDVTERESTIAALMQSEERFRALAVLATEWYWETDAQLRLTVVKGPHEEAGWLEAAILGKSMFDLIGHDNYQMDWQRARGALERREALRRLPFRVLRDYRGRLAYFELSAEPVYDAAVFAGYRGLCWDVTERETLIALLTDSEARFRALTELSSDWYWETDVEHRFVVIRQGAARALPLPESDAVGKTRWDVTGELIRPSRWDDHRADLDARRPFRDLIVRRWGPDGSVSFTLSSGDPMFDEQGIFRGYRGVGKNITEQVRAQERIERLATVDPLTQLTNRQTFDERAGRVLANAYAEGRQCALLFIDLDNFRLLNNGYGHRVGDQMLAIVAERMRKVIGDPNLLGRRGGDELVALLVDVRRPDVAVETAQTIIKTISEPARVLGMEVSVTPSLGISFFPQDGVDLDSLLNAADAAMYQAKESGKRTFAFYTPAVARRVDLRLRLEQRLRKAVETRDFKLFYQPLVSLADGKMIGAECLIRWKDAELGEIAPSEFVPIAEESGLVIGLGDWVVREACRARQVWRSLGLDVPPLAINVSGVQLRQLGCVEQLLGALAEFQVAPGEVEIEVTETGLLDTTAVSRENLVRLRNAGVKLALDDFGVGFSSLSHLRDLPIHRLKIDRSFTVECMRDARTLTIVKAVIEMARSLGINVTAEGIETQAQQTWMQHLGCDSAQGYLFARPMPAEDFLKIFIDRRGAGRERTLMH